MGRNPQTSISIVIGIEIKNIQLIIERNIDEQPDNLFDLLFDMENPLEEKFLCKRIDPEDGSSVAFESLHNVQLTNPIWTKELFLRWLLNIIPVEFNFLTEDVKVLINPMFLMEIPCTANFGTICSLSIDTDDIDKQFLHDIANKFKLNSEEYEIKRWIKIFE